MGVALDRGVAGIQRAHRRLANHYLLRYAAELKEYQRQKKAFLDNPGDTGAKAGGSQQARPTEQRAVRSVSYDEQQEAYYWLRAVEISCRHLSKRSRLFLEARRQAADCRNWVLYTQQHYAAELEKQGLTAGLSEATVRHGWYRLVGKVAEVYLLLRCAKGGYHDAD